MASHAARCPTFLYGVQKTVFVRRRKGHGDRNAERNENDNIDESG